jgi:6-phosphogluconolactonase (cycloisomerase 2 family)
MKAITLLLLMVASSIGVLAQSSFVYTNNDRPGPNSVSAFKVTANGALTLVPGSPFLTGGTGSGGGYYASNRITTAIVQDFLYAGNSGSNNVSAFSIDPVTGVLTPAPGSPFATGGSADIFFGISLATTPNEEFLIAANAGSNTITVYSIAANGALSQIAGSPFSGGAGGSPNGIKVTPDGKFLAVAGPTTNTVSMFGISATGRLIPVPGSPFPAGGPPGSFADGIDCNCSSNQLFIGEGNFGSTRVSVQNISPNGALSPIAGSPFTGPGSNSNVVVLSPDDKNLFVSNQFNSSVTAFKVASSGALTLVPGSPFSATLTPSGMATDRAGKFLYVADFINEITGFSIAANGALTEVPGSPFSNGFTPGTGLLSLAVFPPKTCCLVPVITGATASPDVLWPPNHKFVDVTIDYTETSSCPSTCTLSVTSNEPGPDEWIIVDEHHVQLLAKRNGNGSGRVYTITITCTNAGGTTTPDVTVLVPHHQGH